MKTLFVSTIVLLLQVAAIASYPDPRSGDLIFQKSMSHQANAIMLATASKYTHVGIIEVRGTDVSVIEAVNPVKRTRLDRWIARGEGGKFAVYRMETLTDGQRALIVNNAARDLGKAYDIYFSDLNDTIYCSELVERAFAKSGIKTSWRRDYIRDLNVQNEKAQQLIRARGQEHPVCKGKKLSFEACRDRIYATQLITPVALTKGFSKKYSNFGFFNLF